MKENELELLVNIDDIKYLKRNEYLLINDEKKAYKISRISGEDYLDSNYDHYKYVYLLIDNLPIIIDNYVYEVKIPKENKTLAKYLKDYF